MIGHGVDAQLVAESLKDLSLRLGFRSIDGFAERVVYRLISAESESTQTGGQPSHSQHP